jgi:dTDP-4-amino-4,6-dideoxygalactose transaminase
VPAYHHGSEIETLRQAGLECRFYDCDERLEPDASQLDDLCGPRTRVLHLIHYYGRPQDARRWRAWCDERGLALIEDAAQTWLGWSGEAPVGSFGDLAIFCLHKSFGLPDGGALVARRPPPPPPPGRRRGGRQLLTRHGDWLAQHSSRLARAEPQLSTAQSRREVPSRAFDVGDPDSAPATMTSFLLPRVADAAAAPKRRAHYEQLLERLSDAVPEALRRLPEGSAPYALLVAGPDKNALLNHLEAHGVVGGALWETPHPLLDVTAFPVATRMRSTLVGLPVHQELSRNDVDRIADICERASERVTVPASV